MSFDRTFIYWYFAETSASLWLVHSSRFPNFPVKHLPSLTIESCCRITFFVVVKMLKNLIPVMIKSDSFLLDICFRESKF